MASCDLLRAWDSPDAYRFDPGEIAGPETHVEADRDPVSLVDQSMVYALIGRELIYHSVPFQQETDITGFFRLSAWISIDQPDTDFYAAIYEIRADGSSVRLSTDTLRARYRRSFRKPDLVSTKAPLLYQFKHFTFVARRVATGSRLRLVIAPMGRLVDATFAERNYSGGGAVAEESSGQARPVTVRLYHDDRHRSVLYMPLGRADGP